MSDLPRSLEWRNSRQDAAASITEALQQDDLDRAEAILASLKARRATIVAKLR